MIKREKDRAYRDRLKKLFLANKDLLEAHRKKKRKPQSGVTT
jgi:hypothetical protein